MQAALFPSFNRMAKAKKTSSAPMGMAKAKELAASIAQQHGISEAQAARLAVAYIRREEERGFGNGWWRELLDAQFMTHIGPYKRIRCGAEQNLAHLIPEPGKFCHDCGCAAGEYHVFGCDAEECSNCGEQAFCCDCDDEPAADPNAA